MSVDREQVRKDAERILDLVRDDQVGIVWGDGDEERACGLSVHCLALLAELEQADSKWTAAEQILSDYANLAEHYREAEARLAKVPALVEALRGIAGPKQLRDATNGWLETETEWCRRTAREALAAWESE